MAEMTHVQRVSAARDFAARWKDRGAEKSDTQQFWIDLCSNVLGMEDQTTALHFESRTTGAGWIDVAVPDAKTFLEQKASLQAGELIGKLYKLLHEQNVGPDSAASQHALNVLCVRLMFCLFAEDAGIFLKNAVLNYLAPVNAPAMRLALKRLFKQLDTPMDLRDPYDEQALAVIPYVNGGLFTDANVEIPNFADEIRELLITELSADTEWSQISPTIFGGVFESTLNPETRHAGGMHYTSPENIHKVIDPLFLNALTDELASIINEPGVGAVKRRNNLKRYHDKLAGLTFFEAFNPTWVQNGGALALAT